MNNIFHPTRFWRLLKKSLLERPMQMFGFTGLILAFVLIIYTISKSFIGISAGQNISFIWGFIGGGCFLASFVFAYFNSNASGSSYLTLPASHFEKWLCGIVISGILFPILFLIFFRMMDSVFVGLYHSSLKPDQPFYKEQYESIYVLPYDGMIALKVYPVYLFLTGAMLLGSLYFNKVSFIKVALSICILCIVVFALNWLFAMGLFGKIKDAAPFNHVTLVTGNEEGSIELPDRIGNVFSYTLRYFFPVLLWVLAFTRMREKEI